MPARMPRYDDEEPLGIQFYRAALEDRDLSCLSLPRTFFGRSMISGTSFRNTNLSESCLCWNDFIDVDFSDADLAGADLRASLYDRVSFINARLDGADMRRSSFSGCRFDGASMKGAVLTREQQSGFNLSEARTAEITWTNDEGPEPDGG